MVHQNWLIIASAEKLNFFSQSTPEVGVSEWLLGILSSADEDMRLLLMLFINSGVI